MNLLLLLESMKFHRIKQESAVRLLFVFCYLVNIASYFLPGSDPDLTGLYRFFDDLSQGTYTAPVFTRGNLVFIALSLIAAVLTLLSAYLYAAIFAGERENLTAAQAMKGLLRALPILALCGFLMIIPTALSFFLLMLPIVVLITVLYFLPLNLILGRMSLTDAIAASARDTRHMKFVIFLQFVMLMLVMNLPENLLFSVVHISAIAEVLIAGFFVAARALMRGRLMGLLYLKLVKKVPIVITSKPNA